MIITSTPGEDKGHRWKVSNDRNAEAVEPVPCSFRQKINKTQFLT
jgi:hypothetical protein